MSEDFTEHPEKIKAGIRTLDILPEVLTIGCAIPYNEEDQSGWYLKIKINISPLKSEYVPSETSWYILIPKHYPYGVIKIHPDKEEGLLHTFQHQALNQEGSSEYPWLTGSLCLEHQEFNNAYRTGNTLLEPFHYDWRLYWHVSRAVEWIKAAAQDNLSILGNRFELPFFPSTRNTLIIFSENRSTFKKWSQISDTIGIAHAYLASKNCLFVEDCCSLKGEILFVNGWGTFIKERVLSYTEIAWLRLANLPVLKPWEVPLTWSELRLICSKINFDLNNHLKSLSVLYRGKSEIPLLIGFPLPETIGDKNTELYWSAIILPEFKFHHKVVNGFRNNSNGYWQTDLKNSFTGNQRLMWAKTGNWHSDRIQARGRFEEKIRNLRVAIIGVGAIGSILSELLVRAGVNDLLLIDGDSIEIGNLVRHTLTMDDLELKKAASVSKRLNSISPHANVKFISQNLPFDNWNSDILPNYDLLIDCTGTDSVLQLLKEYLIFPSKKYFVSVSIGMASESLLFFFAYYNFFPWDIYKERIDHYFSRQEIKSVDLPFEGAGCWHPFFPARIDDLYLMTAAAVKLLEYNIVNPPNDPIFRVFRQTMNEGSFSGLTLLEDVK